MKRVGIMTFFYNNFNYGGLLQAYALQHTIEKMGYSCHQISYNKMETITQKWVRRLKQNVLKSFIKRVKKYKSRSNLTSSNENFNKIKEGQLLRQKAFTLFMDEIKHTSRIYTRRTISQCNKDFDIFIVGSDQVWNLDFSNKDYFLSFVAKNKKRIAYAASMGRKGFTDRQCKQLVPYLKSFNRIAVRESASKEYLQNLLQENIYQVVDPTLLVSFDDWDRMAGKRIVQEKYIFVYLLGANVAYRREITQYAKQLQLKIVTIPCVDPYNSDLLKADINFGDIPLYNVGPKEFIGLIKYAEYVFTDSFHGAVFSIIFHKRFFVFLRYLDEEERAMNERIHTLLESLLLSSRLIKKDKKLTLKNLQETIPYDQVENTIRELQKDSLQYIQKALCE